MNSYELATFVKYVRIAVRSGRYYGFHKKKKKRKEKRSTTIFNIDNNKCLLRSKSVY